MRRSVVFLTNFELSKHGTKSLSTGSLALELPSVLVVDLPLSVLTQKPLRHARERETTWISVEVSRQAQARWRYVISYVMLANERVRVKAVLYFAAVIRAVRRALLDDPNNGCEEDCWRQILKWNTSSFQGFSRPSILKWYIRPLARLVSRKLEVGLSSIAKLSLPPTSCGNKVK